MILPPEQTTDQFQSILVGANRKATATLSKTITAGQHSDRYSRLLPRERRVVSREFSE
jgi:hypothetical protein